MDNDDEERSRGIPSRTGIGKRGAIIEKFPGLGIPLRLFGGLINVPFWGYLTTPIAMMEVMMSDLPHVIYNTHPELTKEQEQNRMDISRDTNKKIREQGLKGVKGLNLNFNKKTVIDGDALFADLK